MMKLVIKVHTTRYPENIMNFYFRYCTRWYKIASERVNSIWWETVLAPLKDLEAQATGGIVHLEHGASSRDNKIEGIPIADKKMQMSRSESVRTALKTDNEACKDCTEEKNLQSSINSLTTTRSSLEDMELDTKALTEPLPSNQQVSYESFWSTMVQSSILDDI